VSKSDKKSEIIYEAPKAAIPPSVQALMDGAEKRMKEAETIATDLLGEPLEIYFLIQNSRVRFSLRDLGDAAPAVAKSLVKAVKQYEVQPTTHEPMTAPSNKLGEKTVTYDRYVRVDWSKQTIFTSFTPDEGEAFIGAMAIIVEALQERRGSAGEKS
jgi:hypothetical protein